MFYLSAVLPSNSGNFSGIQFCAGYSAPNASLKSDAPYFPFTGPVSFTVTMNKLDLPNGYKLEIKTIKVRVNNNNSVYQFVTDCKGIPMV